MGHAGGAVLMCQKDPADLLEAAAWALFVSAGVVFVVGTLVIAVAFAPWPLKIVAATLLTAGALGTASSIIRQWRLRH